MKRCRQCRVPLEGTLSKILAAVVRLKPSATDPNICNKCRPDFPGSTYICQICQRRIDEAQALTHVKAEEYLLELIKKDHPEWNKEKGACPACVAYYRELIKKAKI